MTRRARIAALSLPAAAASLLVGVPAASAEPGPSDTVAAVVLCEAAGGPFDIGLVRFRDDDAEQRLRLVIFSGGPPKAMLQVTGRDVSGPGLPGELMLDGGGGGKLDLRGEFVIGDNPAISIGLDGMTVASTDPAECG